MSLGKRERVKFLSKGDILCSFMLQSVEDLLKDFNDTVNLGINDLMELYNAKKYLDEGLFLKQWNEEQIDEMQKKLTCIPRLIGTFWGKIDSTNILEIISNLEDEYIDTFWEILSNVGAYSGIDPDTFKKILITFDFQFQFILKRKLVVSHFGAEIREYLVNNPELSAELLLSKFEQEHDFDKPNYYFPEELTISDKEEIIGKYLDLPEPNANYVGLIVNATILKITPRIKLKAKKRAEEINEKILNDGNAFEWGISVSLSKIQDEPVKITTQDSTTNYSYSVKFFNQIEINKLLFVYSDIFLFQESGIISLIGKNSELGIFEKYLGLRSISEYITGTTFHNKEMLSYAQIILFSEYLKHERNITIEELIQDFINSVINTEYGALNFRFHIPTKTSSLIEKIRFLNPEIDSLLKQYKLFCENGEIDYELLEIDSCPLLVSTIPSKIEKKYIYPSGTIIQNLKQYFFSDQSGLFYLEKFGDKYKNLYELLINEEVLFDEFHDYQKRDFSILIQEGYLEINPSGYLKIIDIPKIYIIGLINKNGFISYWHQKKLIRDKIDVLIQENLLISKSTLFSKLEADYLSYYLNKQGGFMNGHDLRNKYLHGSNNTSEKVHETDYNILLRILIIVLLKIHDDLSIYNLTKIK